MIVGAVLKGLIGLATSVSSRITITNVRGVVIIGVGMAQRVRMPSHLGSASPLLRAPGMTGKGIGTEIGRIETTGETETEGETTTTITTGGETTIETGGDQDQDQDRDLARRDDIGTIETTGITEIVTGGNDPPRAKGVATTTMTNDGRWTLGRCHTVLY